MCVILPRFQCNVFKIGWNGEPVLIESAKDHAAMTWIKELPESATGSYLIVSEITEKKISFAADGAIKRS